MDIHVYSPDEAIAKVASRREGLTATEAADRLAADRSKPLRNKETSHWRLLLNQFRSPLVLLLLAAMTISMALGDRVDSMIVLGVVVMSTLLGFWQESRAASAVAALMSTIQTKATVLREGQTVELPVDQIVAGEVILLSAGDTIPGDAVLLQSKDLFVDESALTGESFPTEKKLGTVAATARQSERLNAVYQGTHVVSGTAQAIILATGADTEFGSISERLRLRSPETNFELGLRHFGEMIVRVTLLFVIAIFAINVYFHRPVLEAFMFALALSVGMTPELLPAIVSITLARGAQRMAEEHVIVRRLAAIENFGSMNVLCSDKTGTLTAGSITLLAANDPDGHASETAARLYAVLNATFESGFANPIDQALRKEPNVELSNYTKFDEVPYDFIRKRLSVVVESSAGEHRHLMITKGAFKSVIAVCTKVMSDNGEVAIEAMLPQLQERFEAYSNDGHRVLGLAVRDVTGAPLISKDDEHSMVFAGFLLFDDPPKPDAALAIQELNDLGVAFKVITGDNRLIARRLAVQMGLSQPNVLTGEDLRTMSDEALTNRVASVNIFAETEPNQKERILIALRKSGHVVGYLGDGINDASALHAADVGISVDTAVDVAKEAADIVLLQNDLRVLARGVRNGRITFANTMKYIFVTTSANFGNMFSMAGASLFLPFLPLLPKQILLNNFLSDLPALTIVSDAVDPEQVSGPTRWDQRALTRFMITFGLVSSLFDYLTFGLLLFVLKANESQFQTAWFIESLMTELFIIMVIRTRRSMFKSKPGHLTWYMILLVAGVSLVLPYTVVGQSFGLVPLPAIYMVTLLIITILYVLASEWAKRWVFRASSQVAK